MAVLVVVARRGTGKGKGKDNCKGNGKDNGKNTDPTFDKASFCDLKLYQSMFSKILNAPNYRCDRSK